MASLSALTPLASADLRAAALNPALNPAAPKSINPAELQSLTAGAPAIATPPVQASGSFGQVLGQVVQEVNAKQAASNQAVQGLVDGQSVSLHQAVIAMEEASVSFQLMVEVRNKLLESYQELMRMQV